MPFFVAPSGLRQQVPRALAAALLLATCAALAWQSANWMRLLRSEPAATTENNPQRPSERPSLERLLPLFGAGAGQSRGQAPLTSMDLRLNGSFMHADPARSSALLQRTGEPARRYRVGEHIDDATRLHAVQRDHIELERNGRIERLAFPRAQQLPGAAASSPEEPDEQAIQQQMDALREQMEATMLEAVIPVDTPEDD